MDGAATRRSLKLLYITFRNTLFFLTRNEIRSVKKGKSLNAILGAFAKIAKNDYELCHVCLSVRLSVRLLLLDVF